jgi:hypothetical protein
MGRGTGWNWSKNPKITWICTDFQWDNMRKCQISPYITIYDHIWPTFAERVGLNDHLLMLKNFKKRRLQACGSAWTHRWQRVPGNEEHSNGIVIS